MFAMPTDDVDLGEKMLQQHSTWHCWNVKEWEEDGVRKMVVQHASERDGKGMLEEEGMKVIK